MTKHLTKENILAAISIIAFIISTSQLIVAIFNKRVKLTVTIQNFMKFEFDAYDTYIFFISFENSSSSDISITNMFMLDANNNHFGCSLTHKFVGERYYTKFHETDIPITERILTVDFPIAIEPNGVRMEFLHFNNDKKSKVFDSNQKVQFCLFTNKKKLNVTLSCPLQATQSFLDI